LRGFDVRPLGRVLRNGVVEDLAPELLLHRLYTGRLSDRNRSLAILAE
jgi:hypothetical protein